MIHPHYDIIMAGGGAASRILLYFMRLQPGFDQLQILVLEAENRIAEKTWCFWTQQQHPFEHLIRKEWTELEFKAGDYTTSESINPYRYCCIHGADFNRFFNAEFFPAYPNVTLLQQKIISSEHTHNHWTIITEHQQFTCNRLVSNAVQDNPCKPMLQHFHGWFIEYNHNVFDENRALLMDFALPGNDQFCFFYVLPFNNRKALVECTYYSAEAFDPAIYQKEIHEYLLKHFGNDFKIYHKEQGAIPLQLHKEVSAAAPALINIGQSAGMIKPSTGYAFQRMVEDSKLLAASLHKEQPVRRKRHRRFRFYDGLLLSIIKEEPGRAVSIFQQLFRKSSMKSILTFLDENSTIAEEAKIFSKLPWWPFLKRIKING
jgi:lycopene beta-cyclase